MLKLERKKLKGKTFYMSIWWQAYRYRAMVSTFPVFTLYGYGSRAAQQDFLQVSKAILRTLLLLFFLHQNTKLQ